MKTRHKRLLILFFIILPCVCIPSYIKHIYSLVPQQLYVYCDRQTVVELNIPVTAVIRETSISIDFSKPVTFQADRSADYSLEYKLFNLISLPSGKLSVLDDDTVYAGGFPIGLYVRTDGVLVAGTAEFKDEYGNACSPCSGILESGDYIVDIDGTPVTKKKQIAGILEASAGGKISIGFMRGGEYQTAAVTPQSAQDGGYKLGIWVKDDAQGIGTVTYIDKNGNFGALGHGINDTATGTTLQVDGGFLYYTNILSISKGTDGVPGEYVGTIDYASANQLGLIRENTEYGVFGTILPLKCERLIEEFGLKSYELGFGYQMHKGDASILVYLDGSLSEYAISIEEVTYRDTKNITFKCTSPELLDVTNGIVQGMSGSPIIQDGKLVGAVTHVFVNDSTSGYGIFIENMMQ